MATATYEPKLIFVVPTSEKICCGARENRIITTEMIGIIKPSKNENNTNYTKSMPICVGPCEPGVETSILSPIELNLAYTSVFCCTLACTDWN